MGFARQPTPTIATENIMEVSRIRNLVFVAVGGLFFVILDKALDWLWASVDALRVTALIGEQVTVSTVIAAVVAIGATLYYARREDLKTFLSEVIIELKKVTWPGWDETKRSTVIVIIFTVVLSVFLWGSDQVWRFLTELILTPGT
jgi:preprotein translocase subunit SecE